MWANTFTPTAVPKKWQLLVEKIRWEEQGEGDLEAEVARQREQALWGALRKAEAKDFTSPPCAQIR